MSESPESAGREAALPPPDQEVPPQSAEVADEEPRDLGFGTVVATESRQRLLNRDGSFNVERRGLGLLDSLSPYQTLLTMRWGPFVGLVSLVYVAVCALFALGYWALGPEALTSSGTEVTGFWRAFFFSVHTLSTVGYGNIIPSSTAANVLMTLESITGLFGVALMAGLIFARFSRPTAHILFSRQAVVAPYRGGRAFMFRIANQRKNQLIDLKAQVLFSRLESVPGAAPIRRFYDLALERSSVTFFPLSWTIVHPISPDSPLATVGKATCMKDDAEFLVLLMGTDETFSQTVHAWSSYKSDEILWDAEFDSLLERPAGQGPISIDVGRLHDVHPAPLDD